LTRLACPARLRVPQRLAGPSSWRPPSCRRFRRNSSDPTAP
jgi:hypothetical protein